MQNRELTQVMNGAIGRLVETATRIAISDFSCVPSLVRILKRQSHASKIRLANEKKGLHVPPFIIASVVRACNLRCKGCYDRAKQAAGSDTAAVGCGPTGDSRGEAASPDRAELCLGDWVRIFGEAQDLGVSFILLAGGEPLLRADLIRSCAGFPGIFFPVFTNGLLIDEGWTVFFASSRNVFPVVSVEGDERLTDARRGTGVWAKVSGTLARLKAARILYGVSITLTSENFECVLAEAYIGQMTAAGARIFFFVEYVPFEVGSESLEVSPAQKTLLVERLAALRRRFPAIFLAFPGDESAFGGCLASGRGFVHVNAAGSVESCPFAPYSDIGVADRSLAEALSSPLLKQIRGLQETLGSSGGCTLFENRAAVEGILAANRQN
jgi:MoaA/NifB/PqqE/SkfB family radical SAM enzyme